ncbi:MAG: putative HTH-type transcriptional regulator [Luteibacter sp.]|uniref:LexA family transcriptional regulator n=1 Tax=Luteibacter sp. TaxID=1886636 RepID=UPI00137D09CF|nr:helix-turn-helix domain-containing protein [Luteibacter sp.]KAF1005446.1 MAG: putative HTH-type transcriptional regulator [Luteibacter sp.]
MNRLASNLRTLIAQQGISENELSERTGVPQPTINRILRGESRDPRDSTVAPLARYFGTTVENMKRGEGAPGDTMSVETDDLSDSAAAIWGSVLLPHLHGFDREAGPASMAFPETLIRELAPLRLAGRLGWVVNPTDSMGDTLPKGAVAFVDRSYQEIRGNGIYVIRLFGEPSIMRVQIRGESALRVMGNNRFEESIDLHGDQIGSLSVGGLVVGFADRIKLIE